MTVACRLQIYDETRKSRLNIARCLLAPLKQGKPVVLSVNDIRAPKKKRALEPLLFLTPFTTYGQLSSKISVAYQAHGCEVVDTTEKVTPLVFIRIGMSPRLAIVFANALTAIFSGE